MSCRANPLAHSLSGLTGIVCLHGPTASSLATPYIPFVDTEPIPTSVCRTTWPAFANSNSVQFLGLLLIGTPTLEVF